MTRVGAFPGTFNPPTIAHLTIAEAARDAHDLDRVDLVVSRSPINKEHITVPTLTERIAVLEAIAATRDWLGVVVTERRLIGEIAEDYDVVVMGADKWLQVNDPIYYDDDPARRDEAVRRLPTVALFNRGGTLLDVDATTVDPALLDVSSTRARNGESHLMAPEAAASGLWVP